MRSSCSKLLATSLICLLALAAPVVAQTVTTTESTTTEFTSVIGTVCTGEQITVTGRVHRLQHTTQTPAGVTSTVTHINVQALGTGQVTGEQYVFTQNTNVAFNTQQPVPLQNTSTETIQIIGRGQTSDRYIRALLHTTINANGELTAEFITTERHCR